MMLFFSSMTMTRRRGVEDWGIVVEKKEDADGEKTTD